MQKIIVTTSQKNISANEPLAMEAAAALGGEYVRRDKCSLAAIRKRFGVGFVVVARRGELVLDSDDGEFFFHPSMAHVRIKNLRHGGVDHLIEAMDIREGDEVIDCTLGLGADAIVESYGAGESGRVVALEASGLISGVVRYGLTHYVGENEYVTGAMRRVKVINEDYLSFLRHQRDDSFDAVYFDPMFRHPLTKSASMHPLREFADMRPVCGEAVREACRVARRRVVLKENSRSNEFSRLGFETFVGGKYSPVRYGVIILDKDGSLY